MEIWKIKHRSVPSGEVVSYVVAHDPNSASEEYAKVVTDLRRDKMSVEGAERLGDFHMSDDTIRWFVENGEAVLAQREMNRFNEDVQQEIAEIISERVPEGVRATVREYRDAVKTYNERHPDSRVTETPVPA